MIRRSRARFLGVLVLAAGFSAGASLLAQEPAPVVSPEQPRPRRPRIPTELSDTLIHSPFVACGGPRPASSTTQTMRIATWNIRAARSAPVEAIAGELKAMRADVIALQEVDLRVRRTGYVDEPVELAAALGYHYAFAASIKWDGGDYGLAVLSRWPLVSVRRYRLQGTEVGEPRIVLEATVCADGRELRLFNHHADGRAAAREAGFAALKDIVKPDVGQGVLVMGDFNAAADTPEVRGLIDEGLLDLGADSEAKTTDGGRIDYVMADRPLGARMSTAQVWPTDKSDHFAVLAELHW
jgi:endonuclease/exonuclease/phosphatase family metal-dependent hydrolase